MDVKLLKVREDNLEQIMEWRMRPDITRYMNTDPELTLDGQKLWYYQIKDNPTQRHWVIYVDDVPSGVMQLFDIDSKNKHCSWGYYVANSTVRSLQLAVNLEWNLYDYVFDHLQLHKLCSETFVENKYVTKLHKLCGSRQDGVMRQHICKNGEYHDISIYSILADEWYEKRQSLSYPIYYFE